MKKTIAVLISWALLFCLLPVTVLAADTSPADGYNDHDYDAIRTFLETEVGGVKNGVRVCGTLYNADDPNTWSLVWMTHGSEDYVYGVYWDNKGLSGTLDLSNFSYLEELSIIGDSFESVNVTGCSALRLFKCSNNQLGSLDLHTNTGLVTLDCSENELTSLNVNGCTLLETLGCYNNTLTTLDVSTNITLKNLYCSDNSLAYLDLSGLTALESCSCDNNQLTSLDSGGCTALDIFSCNDNYLAALDLSTNTALTEIYCSDNQLTALALSANTMLKRLYCSDNQLTALNLGSNTSLEYIYCYNNSLKSLDLNKNTALVDIHCSNNMLTMLNVSGLTHLRFLYCYGNLLPALNLNTNTALYQLFCYSNALTALDLSANTALQYISCTDNPLTQIDAALYGNTISISENGDGYVSLITELGMTIVGAAPKTPGTFIDWTNGGTGVSTDANFTLTSGIDYDLTANFFCITGDPADGKIYTGGRIMLTPSVSGGTWSFDTDTLSRSGNEFTGLKAGTATVTYTLNGVSVTFDVTISAQEPMLTPTSTSTLTLTANPSDGKIYTGGRITITPNLSGGTWSFDGAYLSRDGNKFTGLKTGSARLTYTIGEQSAYVDVTILASELPKTGQDATLIYVFVGLAALLLAAEIFLSMRRYTKRA